MQEILFYLLDLTKNKEFKNIFIEFSCIFTDFIILSNKLLDINLSNKIQKLIWPTIFKEIKLNKNILNESANCFKNENYKIDIKKLNSKLEGICINSKLIICFKCKKNDFSSNLLIFQNCNHIYHLECLSNKDSLYCEKCKKI